jgi:hypothetical protein
MPFHQGVLVSGKPLNQVARELCRDVCKGLREFMIGGGEPHEPEAYTVFCLTTLDHVGDVNQWFAEQRRDIAGLLSETDPGMLSDEHVAETLRIHRSFAQSDLVVIDWDAALVVDLSGYTEDEIYVLELANLQLEEFKVMDGRLDRHLNQVYEELGRKRLSWRGVPSQTLNALRRFRVDLTKLADEVTHITKFFGDWHLARIYLGARDRFHLDHWRQSVDQRLAQLDQIYGVVHSEINERRMLWLEAIIVIFFAIDLIAIFWLK